MGNTRHQIVCGTIVVAALLARPVVAGSPREIPDGPLGERAAQLLERALGDPDPGALRLLATRLSTDELVLAMYRGDRAERQVALELCSYAADPWPLLPYLASFLGSRERQTASRAARSLLVALERVSATVGYPPDVVPGQLGQLADQLEQVAVDERLDLDLRAGALYGLRTLGQVSGRGRPPLPELFEDPEAAMRGAALGMLDPPLADDQLTLLAELAGADQDLTLRGQAAALLCENALSHGVKKPSPDLTRLLHGILAGAATPAEGVAPILACLRRFSPEARADLVSTALGHPDPRVQAYWDELEQAPQ